MQLTPPQQLALLTGLTLVEQHARNARLGLAQMLDLGERAHAPKIAIAGAPVNGRSAVHLPDDEAKAQFDQAAAMFGASMEGMMGAFGKITGRPPQPA